MENENMGVNVEQAAAVQTDAQVTDNQQANTTTPQPETGVDNGAADQRVETAFAKRLAAERAKLEAEYTPYKSTIEYYAGLNSMTPQQYLQYIEQQKQQQETQQYEQAGLNPDLVNKLIEKHPVVSQAKELLSKEQQKQQFQSEAAELFDMFPDIDPKSIPQAVFDMKVDKGITLLDAYLRSTYGNVKQTAQQETVKKLTANKAASPGSLSSGGQQQTYFTEDQIDKMSADEVKKNYSKVMESLKHLKK